MSNQPRQVSYNHFRPPVEEKKTHSGRFVRLILFIVIAVAGGVFLSGQRHFSLLPSTYSTQAQASDELTPNSKLAESIKRILTANPQTSINVSLLDFADNSNLNLGQQIPFEAASTTKLLTAAAFLKDVENGTQSLNETLNTYPASYQLQEMVNDSNNDSWDALMDQVGYPQLETYAHSIGIKTFDVDDNTITAADEAQFLEKLYDGKLLNHQDTQTLLSYMQHTNDEDLIPPTVPDNVTVYHKYGLLDGNLHDVAILRSPKATIALVIFTHSSDDSDDAQRTTVFHQITKTVCASLL